MFELCINLVDPCSISNRLADDVSSRPFLMQTLGNPARPASVGYRVAQVCTGK